MKPLHAAGASDRIATREELSQVMDLIEELGVPQAASAERSDLQLAWLSRSKAPARRADLWLDASTEGDDASPDLESLAEMLLGDDVTVN